MANEDRSGRAQQIEQLEKHLGVSLSEVLAGLYRNAAHEAEASGIRLMRVEEVIDEVDAFAAVMPLLGGVPFFTDDNGSYLFVHLTGPLEGRVSVLMEGYPYCVAFRSVPSLREQLDAVADDDWEESLCGDYFTGGLKFEPRQATSQEIAADRQARQQLRELLQREREVDSYDQGHDDVYTANIIALTPWEDAQSVREFLSGEHSNPFAIEWAGYAGERLLDELAGIAGTYQCGLAYLSLAQIGTAKAKQVLFDQVERCPKGHETSLAQALHSIGVPTRHEIADKQKHTYLVQPSPEEDWQIVGTSHIVKRKVAEPIVIWNAKNQHNVSVSLALTPLAIEQLKRQVESSPEPEKAWVRWQFISRLSSQYGQKVGFKVTKLISPKMKRHEAPYFRLVIDPETLEELDQVGRYGLGSSECTRFVFDYVEGADGVPGFVWLRD
ncbi:hypothetical protein C5Y96_15315 [Blastopirellula marina]|uniref:Uncharacterized protein n=1 Tax=Blastopirellula marina TaxID=124 RepID=A0A2S8FAE4_9BACT|nr:MULTISPECIES: hypothetical protein [Pirellulaceae]PQO29121.1 hypothetical protein C5Y96_15315 [Blastopirellula marina]RCS50312.1 hypothetical protein DTL36_15325 [Bremerella cremea]